jgi:hypothetical protein
VLTRRAAVLDQVPAGAERDLVESAHQQAAQPGATPVVPYRRQVQVGQPVGGDHAQHVADVLPVGAASECAEAAELDECGVVGVRSPAGRVQLLARRRVGALAGAVDGGDEQGVVDDGQQVLVGQLLQRRPGGHPGAQQAGEQARGQ